MAAIRELATITSKGQITLPKLIRQALGGGLQCLATLLLVVISTLRALFLTPNRSRIVITQYMNGWVC